jgi:CRISPR/Cas system-associated exonuclease Cas4 (RecB family)
MLSRCPKQFWYRYVLGYKEPPGAAMHFGSAYHHVQEENSRHKIQVGSDFGEEMAKAVFVDQWKQLAQEVEWELEDVRQGELTDLGVGLVTKYLRDVAPRRFPVEVEVEFDISLPSIVRSFVGKIDLVCPNHILLEHKTAGKAWPEYRLSATDQVQAYYLAYERLFGNWPLSIMYDVAIKTRVPKIQEMVTTRTEHEINEYLGRIETAEQLIEAEIFPKTDPTNWVCSPRFCGYYGNCKQGKSLGGLRLTKGGGDYDLDDAI